MDIDAHLVNVGHREKRGAVIRVAFDEGSNVDVARGDDAVEGRDDFVECAQGFQLPELGLSRFDLSVFCPRVAFLLVHGLLRDSRRIAQ